MSTRKDKTKLNMSFRNTINCFSRLLFIFFLTISVSISEKAQAQEINQALADQGQALFDANCKQCHAFNEVVVGPALKDSHKRWKEGDLIKFILKPQEYITTSGNAYAKQLYEQYKQYMPNHTFLSNDEVKAIVEYIKAESIAPTTSAGGGGNNGENLNQVVSEPGDSKYSTTILVLVVVVLVLVLVMLIVFLNVIKKYLKDREANLDEEDREIVNQKFDIGSVIRSKMFISIVGFIFVCVAVRACWVGLISVGVEQNYAPVQPIPFSHKLHAGDNNIDCNYCHTGAARGKQAGIPSLNICMNCHSAVTKGPKFGEEAIAQVVKAYEENRPIQWVRVHNLPDLSYFNHSQHVTVGGIECQTCHGQIDTMEVVRQHAPLTMGWCVNCHRETVVNGKDNEYYDRLLELHNKKSGMKVADIGGLECAKCHY
ncbi:MAG TPA: c-type cytochrome [Cytophagaceae bacterium]